MDTNEIEFFEIFPWDKNFETGIALIDEQHKKLIYILNKLAAHLANRSDVVILDSIFDELLDYTDYHFKTEEKIWSAHFKDDDWYTTHEKTHDSFIDKVIALKKEENEKPLDDVVLEIVSFLSQWLGYHILDTDKRMAHAVLTLESGASLEEAKVHANEIMSGSMKVLIDTVLAMYDSLSIRTLDLMREKALRKQAEAALLASEERWKFILEDTGESIWDWDILKGTKHSSDPNAVVFDLLLLNNDKDKHPNNENNIRIHPEDISRVRAELQDHLEGKTEFYANKHRVLREDATWSWVSTRGKVVARDDNGNALRMVGTHTDITEREIGSLIFHHSTQAIVVTDLNNNIISVNPAFTEMTDYSKADIFGKNLKALVAIKHQHMINDEIVVSLSSKEKWNGEIFIQKKNGELIPALVNITSVKTVEKFIDHHIVLFSDISEKKQIERTLRQAQKMDAIGLLTGGISHDFNNLLAIILGNIELIETQVTDNDKIGKSVADIKMAGQRGAKLVSQLLSYSRQQPNMATAHNINHIMRKMDSLIARSVTPEIEVNMLFSENLWLTKIDSSDFEEVVLNLVVNARDAMVSHGVLTLETSNCVLDEVFCLAHLGYKPGEYVRLSVTDNGMGMSLEQQEHIFEPFYTTKELGKGTGLGLSMAYSFVDRSQGYIDVNSSPEKGTTFNLYLPRTEVIKQHEKNGAAETVLPVRGSGTILIVDDEPALVLLSKEILSSHGYKVLTAYSGSEALDIIKNENNVDLLFSDVLMSGGMNGYELAEQALALQPDLKVLFVSGFDGDNSIKEKNNSQAFTLIKKPYNSNTLLSEIQALFEDQ